MCFKLLAFVLDGGPFILSQDTGFFYKIDISLSRNEIMLYQEKSIPRWWRLIASDGGAWRSWGRGLGKIGIIVVLPKSNDE